MFVVTACLQGTLLLLAIYFEYFGPERKEVRLHAADNDALNGYLEGVEDHQREPDGQPAEDTPLLQRQ